MVPAKEMQNAKPMDSRNSTQSHMSKEEAITESLNQIIIVKSNPILSKYGTAFVVGPI